MEKNIKYFESIKDELERKAPGKFVVIKDQEVIGIYDDAKTAHLETIKTEENNTFIIKKIMEPDATTQKDADEKVPFSGTLVLSIILLLVGVGVAFSNFEIAIYLFGGANLLFAVWVFKSIKHLNNK